MDPGHRTRRNVGIAACALLLAAAAAWFLTRGESPAPGTTTPSGGAPPVTVAPEAARLAPRAPRPATPAADSTAGDAPTADEERFPLAPADGPVRLRVRYVGAGEPPARLVIEATYDDSSHGVRVEFPRGVVEGRLPDAKQFVLTFRMDDWDSDQRSEVTVPPTKVISLEVMLPQTPTVVAVDAQTRAPISTAYASTEDQDVWEDVPVLPAEEMRSARRIGADERGRIALGRTTRARRQWIGAPGHAWTLAAIVPEDRDRAVALGGGGTLQVDVEGVGDSTKTAVVVARLESAGPTQATPGPDTVESVGTETFLDPAKVPGRYVMEGLPVGRWRVRVGGRDLGAFARPQETAAVEIKEGETTEVRMRVTAPQSLGQDVVLQVVVPKVWGPAPAIDVIGVGDWTSGFGLRASGLGRHPFVEDPPGTWTGRLEGVRSGPYQVSIGEWGFSVVLWVGKSTTSARVEVPPPARLRIRVLDAASGAPLDPATVRVGAPSPWTLDHDAPAGPPSVGDPEEKAAVSHWTGRLAVSNQADVPGEHVLRVPAGRVQVTAVAEGYLPGEVLVDAARTDAETLREVRLSRGVSLIVRAVRSGSVVASAVGTYTLYAVAVENYEANQDTNVGDFLGGSTRIDELHPGTYRVRLRLTGVEKELVQEVVTKAGDVRTVDLEVPVK